MQYVALPGKTVGVLLAACSRRRISRQVPRNSASSVSSFKPTVLKNSGACKKRLVPVHS
jgi:hypothetical protein